jgi:putative hemolysin
MNNSLEIRRNSDGSEYGFCILADGTACDLWDYYRGVCPLLTTPVAGARNPDTVTPGSDLAAAYCTNMNNRLEIRINPDGSNSQICILADGTECDAIAYFEGTCPNAPAPEYTPVDETIVNPYEALCRSKNFTYETKVRSDGSEHGVCIFPDGKECDAWDYYVGYCLEETALEP